jgi:uncharacterized membrane protein YfcA
LGRTGAPWTKRSGCSAKAAASTAERAFRRWQAPPLLPGRSLGLLTFRYSTHSGLTLAFGVLVVALSSIELYRLRVPAGETCTPLAPLLRGLLVLFGVYIHGLFGSGGPLLVYLLRARLPDEGELRATLALLWFALNLPLLLNYLSLGLLRRESLSLWLPFALPFLPAVWLGDVLHRRLSPRRFQIFSGLGLAVQTGVGLWREGLGKPQQSSATSTPQAASR